MIKQILDNLRSTHFETELLEALDWDEELLNKNLNDLSLYFEHFSKEKSPDQVKSDLEKIFNKQARDVIFKYIDYITKRILQEKGNIEYEA